MEELRSSVEVVLVREEGRLYESGDNRNRDIEERDKRQSFPEYVGLIHKKKRSGHAESIIAK